MSRFGKQFVDREVIERAVSVCWHVVIDGVCHEELKATMDHNTVESNNEQSLHEWLEAYGFDLEREIQRENDTFKGVFTFYQLRPLDACERQDQIKKYDTTTTEGMRIWMKAGCPV